MLKIYPFILAIFIFAGCVYKEAPISSTAKTQSKPKVSKPNVKAPAKVSKPIPTKTPVSKPSIPTPTKNAPATPTSKPATNTIPKETTIAPAIKPSQGSNILLLPTINGNLVKVDASGYDIKFLDSTYAGKDVLLVLFGYDCPHCKRQLPAIKKLATNPRLKVLGIHAKSMIGDSRLRSYIRSAGINFDVLSFKNDIKLIRFLRNAGYYDDSVPSDILVHKDGRVEIVNEGTVLSKL